MGDQPTGEEVDEELTPPITTPPVEGEAPAPEEDGAEDTELEADAEYEVDEDEGEDEGEEPPTRKSRLDFILERKERQLEKKKAERVAEIDEEIEKEPLDEETTNAEELVRGVVKRDFGQYFEEVEAAKIDKELNEFFSTEEGEIFKPYAAKIERYIKHPSRANLPVSVVAYEIAGPDLLRIGAKLAQEARVKADESRSPGSVGGRDDDSSVMPNINKMSDKEFAEYQAKIMHGNT